MDAYMQLEFHQKDLFAENSLLHNRGLIFEISLDRNCADEKRRDDETAAATIKHIIESNLLAKGDDVVYYFVCDFLDGKEKGRAKIFQQWGEEMIQRIPTFYRKNYILEDGDNDQVYFLSLVLLTSHPEHRAYVDAFDGIIREGYLPNKNLLF